MEPIYTDKAPAPIGPYSQGIRAGQTIYTSMQIPLDPNNQDAPIGTITEQTQQTLENIVNIITSAGGAKADIVKTTLYLTDMQDWAAINETYAAFMEGHEPARSIVPVTQLPLGYGIACDAIAVVRN